MPSLKIRRLRFLAIEVCKILNKKTPVYLHNMIVLKQNAYSFRYKNTTDVPRVNTTRYGLHLIRYAAS